MTTEQVFFYTLAAVTMLALSAAAWAIMMVRTKDWKRAGRTAASVFQFCWMSVAFALIVVPVYALTRLVNGVQAFFDAACPELTGLVYRVQRTACHHAEERAARWNKSVEYDKDTHRAAMAEFVDDSDESEDDEEFVTANEKAYGGDW